MPEPVSPNSPVQPNGEPLQTPQVPFSPPPSPEKSLPSLAQRTMEWSRPVIALFGLAIFAMAFIIAWSKLPNDSATFNLLVGAVVALVSSISGYYFGSSAGSQKKDEVIQGALADAQKKQ